jgi:hypothetical protein
MIAELAIAGAIASCDWSAPGQNPYRGDPVAALNSYNLPKEVKDTLTVKMKARAYDDVAIIDNINIYGKSEYGNLRGMHFGAGRVCAEVNRSRWGDRIERGLVYCSGITCVIVPTVCNNVSLVTKLEVTEPKKPSVLPPMRKGGQVNQVPEPGFLFMLALLGVFFFTGIKRK